MSISLFTYYCQFLEGVGKIYVPSHHNLYAYISFFGAKPSLLKPWYCIYSTDYGIKTFNSFIIFQNKWLPIIRLFVCTTAVVLDVDSIVWGIKEWFAWFKSLPRNNLPIFGICDRMWHEFIFGFRKILLCNTQIRVECFFFFLLQFPFTITHMVIL